MLGSIDPWKKKCIVVGGGISGLLVARELKHKGYEVVVYEKELNTGGLVSTQSVLNEQGVVMGIAESAAHSILVTPKVRKFLDKLKIEMIPLNKNSRERFVFRNAKLCKIPFQSLGLLGFLGLLIRLLFKPSKYRSYEYISMQEWGEYYLGKNATNILLLPFVRGIYGVTPSELNVQAAFSQLMIPKNYSFILWKVLGYKRSTKAQMQVPLFGMSDLIRNLEKGVTIVRKSISKVEELDKEANIIICTPAYTCADLILDADPEFSEKLQKVKYAPLVSVTAILPTEELGFVPNGVGVLMTNENPIEFQPSCLGILFNSNSFKNRVTNIELTSFTLMYGGSKDPEFVSKEDVKVQRKVLKDLNLVFGLTTRTISTKISKWERAIPIYDMHVLKVLQMSQYGWCRTPGHVVFGNYTGQVSIRGMIETVMDKVPDCKTLTSEKN